MDFFFFLLVNAVLFIRPSEMLPATYGWPIYEVVIVMNLLVAGPAILRELSPQSLVRTPVAACVLGFFGCIMLSQVFPLGLRAAFDSGCEFAKIILYFLLLLATVNTPRRLLMLLAAIVTFALAVNVMAVLDYHGYIDLPTVEAVMDGHIDEVTGEDRRVARMCGTGIFGDPNDLSMIIAAAMLICAAGLFYQRLGFFRLALMAPLSFFFYALTLTHSRGGLLALMAGGGVMLHSWLGGARGGMLAMAGLPVLLLGIGGRQTDISGALSGGTGQSRVELWSAGLQMLRSSPLLGVGYNQYAEEAGQVAHNSFVHAFGELGLAGGMMFLGIFAIAGWSLWSLRSVRHYIADPGLRFFLPCVTALVAAYCTSMMSLTRCSSVAIYTMAGTAVCYDRLARPSTLLPPMVFDSRLLQWLAFASLGFVALIYVYIRIFFR